MTCTITCNFSTFFRALWDYEPFPWQSMLADRVAGASWPQVLDLPTAAGKTACIDIALYALAAQAERAAAERTAPRRIWFVVDRRIVVDEASARAKQIAECLGKAKEGPLHEIAERLRAIGGMKTRPLSVARLRGGVLRDDGWARRPSQPAIITSTVDQLGSRLLFRGYGHSALTAPIYAGLAANDSLVILDEAHCSVPFLQTLRAIETYRGPRWATAPIPTPFSFAILSATPPAEVRDDAVFPGALRDEALDHKVLRERMNAVKRADLVLVPAERSPSADALVEEAVDRALCFVSQRRRRIGVIINRVRTAEDVYAALAERLRDRAEVVLLTGRMRPFDRDRLVERYKPYLRASAPAELERPIVVVSTQCLEVGADFSFDALISEAASLDALRQRFGRLDRMGKEKVSQAVILIRDRDADPDKADPDPIYGAALAETWKLLNDRAEDGAIDFGIEALRTNLSDVDDLSPYLARSGNAPILLPAHLDMLCQTAPPPEPEPDVGLFLHGKEARAPEVQVLWRADLDPGDTRAWIETVALCPPVTAEMLSAPLRRLRAFLARSQGRDESSDIEGTTVFESENGDEFRPCVVWRGRERSRVAREREDVKPGDVVVLPAAYGMQGLGHFAEKWFGESGLDVWELAQLEAGRQAAVRIHRAVLQPWSACPRVAELLEIADAPELDRERIDAAIDAIVDYVPDPDDPSAEAPPAGWRTVLERARKGLNRGARGRVEEHPGGGIVLISPPSLGRHRSAEPDLFADDDDLTSAIGEEVSLDEHSDLVRRTVEKIAAGCVPEQYLSSLTTAAYFHDVGKLDERFQVLLRQGDEIAVLSGGIPLAKSEYVPLSPARRRFIREAGGLPRDFRHEMLSLQLAERYAPMPENEMAADLVLHLIASHHGHARPLSPVSSDPEPPAVNGRLGELSLALSAKERMAIPAPHRIDSGIANRFWRLVRHHGWWGLCYLEAIVRLGDWYASGYRLRGGKHEGEDA
jgi:CRISPR-associated endonuclease/helicase Cas3